MPPGSLRDDCMLVAFARYTKDNPFQALRDNKPFVIAMTIGSIAGTSVEPKFMPTTGAGPLDETHRGIPVTSPRR